MLMHLIFILIRGTSRCNKNTQYIYFGLLGHLQELHEIELKNANLKLKINPLKGYTNNV